MATTSLWILVYETTHQSTFSGGHLRRGLCRAGRRADLLAPSYKEKKKRDGSHQAGRNCRTPTDEPRSHPDPAAEEAAQRAKYADLIARNPEFAGWIEIPGVDIDLPILQTTDNYFYLYHDLDRADDKRGMPFADYECDMKNGRHLYHLRA